jgi:N-acetylglucosaminyldiphosphoundecaprenol N-acetyl-beta-D-mannosaminyltransferase
MSEEAAGANRTVWVWGLPLAPYTLDGALARIDELVAGRAPGYVITANLHYAMLSAEQTQLRDVNAGATFILADGMPLVWASRRQKTPLPERVAGSDLIWKLAERAAARGHRLFLLGGAPGVADAAVVELRKRFPGLTIAGTACPPFRSLAAQEEADLIRQVRDSRPDILLVAFGQPKGELWIADHYEKLQVPVCVQVGASFDFVAGKVKRAPRWAQRCGLEWAYRLAQEPRRLIGRYARNAVFLARMLIGRPSRRRPRGAALCRPAAPDV